MGLDCSWNRTKETLKLSKQFPIFNYVLTSDTPSEPPAELRSIGKEQSLVEVGEKGEFAVVIGLYNDGSVRYQRVALDSRYESSPEITLLMKDYQSILKNLITSKGFRGGLGVNPARSPQAELLGKYVGAQKCRSCHEESYRVWVKSRHATAWKSLKETKQIHRVILIQNALVATSWDGRSSTSHTLTALSEKPPNFLTLAVNVAMDQANGIWRSNWAMTRIYKKHSCRTRLGENVKKFVTYVTTAITVHYSILTLTIR